MDVTELKRTNITGFTVFDIELDVGAESNYARRIYRVFVRETNGVPAKVSRIQPRWSKSFHIGIPKSYRKVAVGLYGDELAPVYNYIATQTKFAFPIKPVAAKKPRAPKVEDNRDYAAIFVEAKAAAQAACQAIVAAHKGPGPVDHVGACGFAWARLPKAQGPFVAYLKKAAKNAVNPRPFGERAWDVGWEFWNPGDYVGQRVDIKEAGAAAFVAVLKRHGINAYAGSRLD